MSRPFYDVLAAIAASLLVMTICWWFGAPVWPAATISAWVSVWTVSCKRGRAAP